MADECIHGFEAGLCDSCYPRQAKEPAIAVVAPGSRRNAAPKRVPGARSAANAPAAVAQYVFAQQRLYHVTHLQNLAGIIADEVIRADAVPAVDVSAPLTRELRASTEVASGDPVSHHVPFFLSPDASRWDELRTGALGAHWSDEARASSPLDFVILVTEAGNLGPDSVLSDGDAAAPSTRFAVGADGAAPFLRRVRGDDPDFLEPEVLAPAAVPFDVISLIGVANDRVRDQVKALLRPRGDAAPKVAVYPPWFQPTGS
ncbi:MAG TPA: DarT ssDNA thymidine ADP-ribosyltransferase family protein [Pseudolysinimonas sp.]|nr:DarT ssDNA thymidine ADP-ribosyltransferase family protein [Pseudolysinimonas sp.]